MAQKERRLVINTPKLSITGLEAEAGCSPSGPLQRVYNQSEAACLKYKQVKRGLDMQFSSSVLA